MRLKRSKSARSIAGALAVLAAAFVYTNMQGSYYDYTDDPEEPFDTFYRTWLVWQHGWPRHFLEREYDPWEFDQNSLKSSMFTLDIANVRSVNWSAFAYNVSFFTIVILGAFLLMNFHRDAISAFRYHRHHLFAVGGWIAAYVYLYSILPILQLLWVLCHLVMIGGTGAACFGYVRGAAYLVEKRFAPERTHLQSQTENNKSATGNHLKHKTQARPSKMALVAALVVVVVLIASFVLHGFKTMLTELTPQGHWQAGWPWHFLEIQLSNKQDHVVEGSSVWELSAIHSVDWLRAIYNTAAFTAICMGAILFLQFRRDAIAACRYRVYHLFAITAWVAAYFHVASSGFGGTFFDISLLVMFVGIGIACFGYTRWLGNLAEKYRRSSGPPSR